MKGGIAHWFFGNPHNSRFDAEQENKRRAVARCGPIVVSPEELAAALDCDGVAGYKAKTIIEKMLERAEYEANARTLGVEP